MNATERELRKIFAQHKDVLYGFANIQYSEYYTEYASALVVAIPYVMQDSLDTYSEEKFDLGIELAQRESELLLEQIENTLQSQGICFWIPPTAQENETELKALFSFKFAAVNSGMGWIGKNDVLVTKKYGPRVHLSVVLIDETFEYGHSIVKSECNQACTACVDACPCKALTNRLWSIDSKRGDIIDYDKCNKMRSAFFDKLGRKNACGLCMAACPIGRQN